MARSTPEHKKVVRCNTSCDPQILAACDAAGITRSAALRRGIFELLKEQHQAGVNLGGSPGPAGTTPKEVTT